MNQPNQPQEDSKAHVPSVGVMFLVSFRGTCVEGELDHAGTDQRMGSRSFLYG
jgi:hypothetical protein